MSKFTVTVFDNEKSAYEGSRALAQLDSEGSVVVYAAAVISKDQQGAVQVEDAADEGPMGMALGALLGGMIGALAGPAGMVAGAAGGSLGGWFTDMYNVGIDGQFLSDVSDVLAPGKYAVVAEIAEGWTAPLDTRMEALGGTTFRRWRIDVEDEQIERDIEATNRDLAELEEEWDQAAGEAKEKLQAKVDATRAKLKSLNERAHAKVDSMQKETEAKLQKLEAQIAKAKDDAKVKFQKRHDEIKADCERRLAKLKEASKLTAEALS